MSMYFFISFSFCSIVFAEKQEWIDKQYDFKANKSIYIEYQIAENLYDGIIENESKDIFSEKFLDSLKEKCAGKNISLLFEGKDENNINNTPNTEEPPDLILKIYLEDYTLGSSYRSGYSYTTVVPQTATVWTPSGPILITTKTTQTHNVEGRNVSTAFVTVRFAVIDVKTQKIVWARIDNRAKQGDVLRTPKSKNVLGRILKDFQNDFQKQVLPNNNKNDDIEE